MILWANNIDSAILVSRCEDTPVRADWDMSELPPVEFFSRKATDWTYGEIVKSGCGTLMECAKYGSDGEFQFKEVWLTNSKIYFRSRRRVRSELPCAISLL